MQRGHLIRRFVAVVHRQFVVPLQNRGLLGHAQHDIALHIQSRVKVGFLRQIADFRALGRPGLTLEIGVHARHDLQQRRFTRTVDAHDTDLDAGQEVQVDILKALLAARIGLGDAFHVVDILIAGHGDSPAKTG